MSAEILFNRVQREALALPSQLTPAPCPEQEVPYTLGQAAEVREYATRRRDDLLARGGAVSNMDIEADFVQTAIVSLEGQIRSEMTPDEASELISELEAKEAGFLTAGVAETGLRPPKSYRRIGAVAAGFVRNIEKNQRSAVAV